MVTELTTEELELKLDAFNDLKTVEEKIEFWNQELNMGYDNFLQDFHLYPQFHSFEICSTRNLSNDEKLNNTDGWKELNFWLLENWKTKETERINIEDFKKAIDNKMENTDNKAELINFEFRDIDRSSENFAINNDFFPDCGFYFQYYVNWRSYSELLNYKISPDYSKIPPGINTIWIDNAIILAKYKNYLETLKKKYIKNTTDTAQDNRLSNNQIALLLEYAGVLDALVWDTTVKARLFSALLNVGEKKLYDCFREVKSDKNKNNKTDLEAVYNFMGVNDLKSLSKKLKADLEKLT